MKAARNHRLSYRHEKFLCLLLDPTNKETYLKPQKAYREVYPSASLATSKVNPYVLMKKPKIRNVIEEHMEGQGFGVERRADLLREIAEGAIKRTVTVCTKAGPIKIEENPSFTERLKALEIANRMSGTYEQQKAAADIAKDDYKRLANEMRKELNLEILPDEDDNVIAGSGSVEEGQDEESHQDDQSDAPMAQDFALEADYVVRLDHALDPDEPEGQEEPTFEPGAGAGVEVEPDPFFDGLELDEE